MTAIPLLITLTFFHINDGVLFVQNQTEEPTLQSWQGKIVPYEGNVKLPKDLLKPYKIKLDPDAGKTWLALQLENGDKLLILQDGSGRMFYRDPFLWKKPMKIRGRKIPNTDFLQVYQPFLIKNNKLHEIYYWCEICSIKRYYLGTQKICECCGEPMERRFPLAKPDK